jgi:hypothetical protein
MIVFNLACEQQHLFEGWFGSSDDFESQRSRGLIECPACGNKTIEKKLSAPRLNLGASAPLVLANDQNAGNQDSSNLAPSFPQLPPTGNTLMAKDERSQALVAKMQSMWMEMAKEVIANTEDVGTSFAEEARRIHYHEAPERGIRGKASPDEAQALRDEGIEIATVILPEALKGSLQ